MARQHSTSRKQVRSDSRSGAGGARGELGVGGRSRSERGRGNGRGSPYSKQCETTRVGKLHLNSTRNRCDLQWFLMELMPLKTPLWAENYNLIPQVTAGKKHPLRLCRGGICDEILDIHNPWKVGISNSFQSGKKPHFILFFFTFIDRNFYPFQIN